LLRYTLFPYTTLFRSRVFQGRLPPLPPLAPRARLSPPKLPVPAPEPPAQCSTRSPVARSPFPRRGATTPRAGRARPRRDRVRARSEEHTSELQSPDHL